MSSIKTNKKNWSIFESNLDEFIDKHQKTYKKVKSDSSEMSAMILKNKTLKIYKNIEKNIFQPYESKIEQNFWIAIYILSHKHINEKKDIDAIYINTESVRQENIDMFYDLLDDF